MTTVIDLRDKTNRRQRAIEQGMQNVISGLQMMEQNKARERALKRQQQQDELVLLGTAQKLGTTPDKLLTPEGQREALLGYQAKQEYEKSVKLNKEAKEQQRKQQFDQDKLEQEQKQHKDRMALEYAKLKKKTGGQLTPNVILKLSEGNAIPNMLQDVKLVIDRNSKYFGPVEGVARGANPYSDKGQAITAQMKAASQAFGRYMEGGVLRKEDEVKYEKMFPQIGNTAATAKNKLKIVARLLQAKQNEDLLSLQKAGYDVTPLRRDLPLADLPEILTGEGKEDKTRAQQSLDIKTAISQTVGAQEAQLPAQPPVREPAKAPAGMPEMKISLEKINQMRNLDTAAAAAEEARAILQKDPTNQKALLTLKLLGEIK